MIVPRYFRARQSHCLYTNDVHLYVFPWATTGARTDSGVTVKRRGQDGRWRHYSLRFTKRRGHSLMLMLEAVTHLSEGSKSDRVLGSKRYIRLKASL